MDWLDLPERRLEATPPDPITRVQLSPYRLRLRAPWTTARGRWKARCGWLVRLETAVGMRGFGDCAPLPEAGTESAQLAADQLRGGMMACLGLTPRRALMRLQPLREAPAARCALETALLDLAAKQAKCSLAHWLNPNAGGLVAVNAVIGSLNDALGARLQDALAGGYRVLKVKVGLLPVAQEVMRLCALAEDLPAGASLRLDANGRWDEAGAAHFLRALRGLPIESLEEPLAIPEAAVLRCLQHAVPWPLALDESLAFRRRYDLFAEPSVRRLVLKPMVLGGLLPSLRLAHRARALGLDCVVTTTVDSAVGVWAAAHLAGALDTKLAHGLATSGWLQEDVGTPPCVQGGRLCLGGQQGLGFSSSPDIAFSEVCA